ncbi:MAG: YkvA family protein [Burkholderiales bacterium]
MSLADSLRTWARRIKADALTLWFCARHPHTPLAAKLLALFLAAYAFSPIDLIPDFIPVLGLLDELILLPLGIALCIKLVPAAVIEDCRRQAADWSAQPRPRSYAGAAAIVLIWGLALWACWRWLAN